MLIERPLSGELFAGVGGLERGVEAVFGTRAAFFAEVDPAPSKVLAHRYPGVPNLGDVTKVRWADAPKVRVLSGGFPCTDVSLAGRRAGMKGTRSGLWSEFARAIDELRPDWVVIENVRGLLSTEAVGVVEQCPWCVGDDGGQPCLRALGAVLADLAELGFDAEWLGVPASDVGAPHQRFRVFILAWPAENICGGGGGGWSTGSESSGRDDASYGSDSRGDGGRGDRADLLPTPVASPSGNSPEEHLRKKPGRKVVTDLAIMAENDLIRTGGMLPTPTAADSGASGGSSPSDVTLTDAVVRTDLGRRENARHTLPTPGAYDGDRGGSQDPEKRRAGGHSITLQDVAENLLPTPTVALADGGQSSRSGDRKGEPLLGGIAAEASSAQWGKYQAAIDLWSGIVGRPAPAPVRMDGRGGKARLNPELTEWMMGWPLGWVTDAVLGLTRNEQLRACGNGVVPQQAAYALRLLLARDGVPEIGWELAA